ncbi:trypsin-like peptidase domain-containing protein [Streptomyces sp. NPDC002328]|uniref:VMAP-C domain-containing protein n=1 Tax=Streptomyces sp. NPDC002328 TaxID=3364642 RepID=UPI00369C5380
MPEPYDAHLESLIEKATVHFHSARDGEEEMWGSGFFVAPGWILTCAHVLLGRIGEAGGDEFRVRGPGLSDGRPLAARLEESLSPHIGRRLSEGGRALPVEQDLALVRLLDPSVPHECVWLSDRSVLPLGGRRTVYGYLPLADGAAQAWKGKADVVAAHGPYTLRLGPTNEFPGGVSGGPVLDPATGAVVALIKSRRGDRDGGVSIAVPLMRRLERYQDVVAAHDEWHHERRRTSSNWISRQTQLPGAPPRGDADQWHPLDRRQALALLAAVEPADASDTVVRLVRAARGDDPVDRRHPPVSWRDGHGLLDEEGDPQDAYVFLRYLRLVRLFLEGREPEAGDAVRRLGDWIEERSVDLRASTRRIVEETELPASLLPVAELAVRTHPGPGDRGVVVLELEPLHEDPSRVFWTLRVDDGGESSDVPCAEQTSGPGVDIRHLREALAGPLAQAFELVDRPELPAPLEVALDLSHFDTPLHEWQIYPSAPLWDRARQQLLGVRRPVVIRDRERRGVPAESWDARWHGMVSSGRLTARYTVFGGEPPDARRFAEMPPGEVPVQCRPAAAGAGRTAMRLALDAGHGVALWYYGGHPGQECGPACTELERSAVGFLDELRDPAELPDHVRRIREHISKESTRHWADTVAVLYDDPRRPLPSDEGVFDAP